MPSDERRPRYAAGRIAMPRLAVPIVTFMLAFATTAWGQASYADVKTAVGWAFARIRNDEIADFSQRCGKLDPHNKTGWDDPCRRIPSRYLFDVLTVPKWRSGCAAPRAPYRGPGRWHNRSLRRPDHCRGFDQREPN